MFWIKKEMLRFIWINRLYISNLIQENISLIHDSINEKIVVTSGEKDKYIWVSSAQSRPRFPGYLDRTEKSGFVNKK